MSDLESKTIMSTHIMGLQETASLIVDSSHSPMLITATLDAIKWRDIYGYYWWDRDINSL